MSYSEKLLKGGFVVFVLAIAGSGLGYLLRIYLARSLSVNDFGLFYSIITLLALVPFVTDLGLSTTLVKFLGEFRGSGKKDQVKSSIFMFVLLRLALAIIIFIPMLYFSREIALDYFKTADAAIPLQLIVVSGIIGIVYLTLQVASQGLENIKTYAFSEPVRLIALFCIILPLAALNIVGLSYAYILSAIISLGFVVISLKLGKKVVGKKFLDQDLMKRMLSFGLPLFIGGLSGFFLGYVDTILITLLRGVTDVALYQAAMPTSQILWTIVTSLNVILLPTISEMWAKNQKKEVSSGLGLLSKIAFIFVIPFSIIMFAFSEDILNILFGPAYVSASLVLQILAINAIFYTLYVIFSTALIATGRPIIITKITVLISVINICMNIAFIPSLGIVAAALSTIAAYTIGSVIAYLALRKTMSFGVDIKALAMALIGGLVSLAIIFFIRSSVLAGIWTKVVVSIVASTIFYVVFILKTKTIKMNELAAFRQLNIPIPRIIMRILSWLAL